MNSPELIRRLHQHRMWVNHNLLAAAGTLSVDQLQQAFPIGQGTLWNSLLHMWAAEHVWLAALLGIEDALAPGDERGKLPGNQLGEDAIKSLTDLKAKWAALDQRWADYLAELTPECLNEMVYRVPSSGGVRFGTKRVDVLLHVATHAHYTAAQVVNMLRQVGVERLPEVMLMAMARTQLGE
jgi:uncharacterized damage-inducible protein DinB